MECPAVSSSFPNSLLSLPGEKNGEEETRELQKKESIWKSLGRKQETLHVQSDYKIEEENFLKKKKECSKNTVAVTALL